MKERPILFSAPMVRAILEGRKTVTRRVLKPQPELNACGFMRWAHKGVLITDQNTAWSPFEDRFPDAIRDGLLWLCPYGQPGDRLWVRETCFINDYREANVPVDERADVDVVYGADPLPDWEGEESLITWRPSIHMPRWASRILLEITDVRVERLQGISASEALAEGICEAGEGLFHVEDSRFLSANPRESFALLWDSLNEQRGVGWQVNPWVWVVEFKRVELAA